HHCAPLIHSALPRPPPSLPLFPYTTLFRSSPVRATTSSWAALRAGDHEKAGTLARRELEQEPRAIQPRLTLAEVALARRQHAEALEYTAQVLALQPEEYDALLLT